MAIIDFILNYKQLNKFVSNSHFRIEDHRNPIQPKMIPRNGFVTTLNVKAYLLVPISTSHRKYLRFTFKNKSNEKVALLFKILWFLIYYDFLCIGITFEECLRNVNNTFRFHN